MEEWQGVVSENAKNSHIPKTADIKIKIRSLVMVHSDDERKQAGLHKVIDAKKEILKLDHGGRIAQFLLDRCYLYRIAGETRNLYTN